MCPKKANSGSFGSKKRGKVKGPGRKKKDPALSTIKRLGEADIKDAVREFLMMSSTKITMRIKSKTIPVADLMLLQIIKRVRDTANPNLVDWLIQRADLVEVINDRPLSEISDEQRKVIDDRITKALTKKLKLEKKKKK